VRAVLGWRIAPPPAVPDDEDNAAYDPPIINPRHAVRQRKKYGSIRRICASDNQIRSLITARPCAAIE